MTETFDPRALAAGLHSLRLAGTQEETGSFMLPPDLDQAVKAQNFLAAADRISSDAWKVTVSPQGQAVAAPLHPYVEAVSGASIPWHPGLKFETEIAVRLGKDLPIRTSTPYSRAEVTEAVSAAYLAPNFWSAPSKKAAAFPFSCSSPTGSATEAMSSAPRSTKAPSTPPGARRSRSPMPAARSMMALQNTRRATSSPGSSTTPMTGSAPKHR